MKGKSFSKTLQQVTIYYKVYKNSEVKGLLWKLLKSSFFSKGGDKFL